MSTAAAAELGLLDTNVLVYAMDEESEFNASSRSLLLRAADGGPEERPCATPQVFAEFFAVVTSPRRVRSPRTPDEALKAIEQFIVLPSLAVLPVPVDLAPRWIALVRTHQLSAARVFGAQLVATMLANGGRRIYTFDQAHFEPFIDVEVVTPR